jgi:hypothetical protein
MLMIKTLQYVTLAYVLQPALTAFLCINSLFCKNNLTQLEVLIELQDLLILAIQID